MKSFFQELVDSSAQRLVKLANQWEKHRAPLIAQYRELKELVDHKQVSLIAVVHHTDEQ